MHILSVGVGIYVPVQLFFFPLDGLLTYSTHVCVCIYVYNVYLYMYMQVCLFVHVLYVHG